MEADTEGTDDTEGGAAVFAANPGARSGERGPMTSMRSIRMDHAIGTKSAPKDLNAESKTVGTGFVDVGLASRIWRTRPRQRAETHRSARARGTARKTRALGMCSCISRRSTSPRRRPRAWRKGPCRGCKRGGFVIYRYLGRAFFCPFIRFRTLNFLF